MKDTSGMTVQQAKTSADLARDILQRIFRDFKGCVLVHFWDNTEFRLGQNVPELTLTFHSAKTFRTLILSREPLCFLESYIHGLVDAEGDLYIVLKLRDYLTSVQLSPLEKATLAAKTLTIKGHKFTPKFELPAKWKKKLSQKLGIKASKELNRDSISFHYDVSNDFYALWLDEQMVYSCAYYEDASQSLEQAQCNKLDHICRKLRLKPDERMLDIGCGWGALICWAAEHYGVYAHGITLSQNQFEYAQKTIKARGLEQKVTVELLDYRDLKGEAKYDKLASVGMFEHVGLKNLPTYFAMAYRMLKPGGLFLNHGITSEEGGWEKGLSTEFINRYVFPDGQLEAIGIIQTIMEDSAFEIHDVESLRQHYALTLREWVKRLESQHATALQHVTEPAYRIWRLYMAACALQFEEGSTGIYQILASRREPFASPIPLTRRDLYN